MTLSIDFGARSEVGMESRGWGWGEMARLVNADADAMERKCQSGLAGELESHVKQPTEPQIRGSIGQGSYSICELESFRALYPDRDCICIRTSQDRRMLLKYFHQQILSSPI